MAFHCYETYVRIIDIPMVIMITIMSHEIYFKIFQNTFEISLYAILMLLIICYNDIYYLPNALWKLKPIISRLSKWFRRHAYTY